MNGKSVFRRTLVLLLGSLLPAAAGCGTGAISAVPASTGTVPAAGRPETGTGSPHGVVLFIGDGMGVGQLGTASYLLAGPGGRLAITRMSVTGLVTTWAANNLVTDSAAAATAMATGVKTNRRTIGRDPGGRNLPNLFEAAHGAGLATGIVTTSGLADATPAGFSVQAETRYEYGTILRRMLASPFDLLVGGDFTRYERAMGDPAYRETLEQASRFAAPGTTIVRDLEGLRRAEGRVVALLPPRADHPEQHGPPLAVTVALALDRLAADPEGFLLLVETELTDEAGHHNDLDSVLEGVRELDAAVAAALAHPDVLVLVTADHDTGGAGIVDGPLDGKPAKVEWLTRRHTALWVPLFAQGPGAAAFTGLLDNTDLPHRIAGALGLQPPGRAPDAEPTPAGRTGKP